jgi:putative spermidine/putrescine transport system ATP-binding protein
MQDGPAERRPVPGGAATEHPYLALTSLSKTFDSNAILRSFSLTAAKGEFITLLGPSGCGKTTLLRLIAGLLRADAGTIEVDGRNLTRLPAYKRNIGMVFQSYALFPHLDVAENVAFGLKAKGLSRAEIERHVGDALETVQLREFSGRSVRALSGGQQQRVSLARAMVVKPTVMLLDEPFSALDRNLRESMQIETRHILRRIGATAIFVTHDQAEALVMSDRIAVMNRGRAEQIADPKTVYSHPATPFVLGFVGQALRLQARAEETADGTTSADTRIGRIRIPGSFARGAEMLAAVRPELVELGVGDGRHNTATLRVRELAFLGSKTQVMFEASGNDSLMAELPGPPPDDLRPAVAVTVRWPIAATLGYLAGA